jgi:hypothetical protein
MTKANKNEDESLRIRFCLAHVLFHELTHVLVTYMYDGRVSTPVDIMPPVWIGQQSNSSLGEAGRYLEEDNFGGVLEIFDNPEVRCSRYRFLVLNSC